MFKTFASRRRFIALQRDLNRAVSSEIFDRYQSYVIRCSDGGGYPIGFKDWLAWGNAADD